MILYDFKLEEEITFTFKTLQRLLFQQYRFTERYNFTHYIYIYMVEGLTSYVGACWTVNEEAACMYLTFIEVQAR